MKSPRRVRWVEWALLAAALAIPPINWFWMRMDPAGAHDFVGPLRQVLIYAVLALGLNIVTGFTGLLHLGMAAFMAVGAYAYGILTCEIYPFQLSFWPALGASALIGTVAGLLLGAPTMALRGDYLAIVTLGFGEIVQDVLKNLDDITQGTQGINPLPGPVVPGYAFNSQNAMPWYYLYLGILVLVVVGCRNLEWSRPGRAWLAIRVDELAARCMGIPVVRQKMLAFAAGAALAAIAGAMMASMLTSTGEPANYDFQVSILALCIVIVGGMGSITGVLVGAVAMIGFANVLLPMLAGQLQARGLVSQANVFGNPNNWKYLIFGLVLVLMMRFRPQGLLPRAGAARAAGKSP
ncbi:MAG: branched-chain amino acid ABC transporter permease [Phycisphaerae bacterium]|nr:branched-chain amino acid ABC transporter permease [Phycisphaerae bacterium]